MPLAALVPPRAGCYEAAVVPPPSPMLHGLYRWTMGLAVHPRARTALAAVAFAESVVFPVPPDLLLAPMTLADRPRAFRLAAICTVASVMGGIAGYVVGAVAFETLAVPLLEFYGTGTDVARFRSWYGDWGLWIVLAAGLTPLPYKVFTLASGAALLNPVAFVAGSLLSRGLRFFAVAGLLWWFGEPIRRFVERRLALAAAAFVVVLVGSFALVRYVL